MVEREDRRMNEDRRVLLSKLDAASWGILFIWIGIGFLTDMSWGIGLLGVGVIALVPEVVRRYFGFPVEWFWLITGVIFVVWGVSELVSIPLDGRMLAIMSLVVGVVIVVAAVRRRSPP